MIYNMSILKQGEDMEMKIIKRDGSIVDYNPEKIRIAIKKANNEVSKQGTAYFSVSFPACFQPVNPLSSS